MASAQPDKTMKGKLLVAAIDFGTTFSGYAFAFQHDVMQVPPKIHVNSNWIAGGQLISHKTPTVLLLNPDQTLKEFGYKAEDTYAELASEDKHKAYYYFRRFKMTLYKEQHLKRDTQITDEQGKKMNAIEVFSICIKYLKDNFMELVKNRVMQVTDTDVHWVLTVPAIWHDGAKQFMREAAQMAGINGDELSIALEPEAASLFCMHLPVDKIGQADQGISPFSPGTKYMVVDVGGGTVDITVHEVVGKSQLKELKHATGGAWGGTRVDNAYEQFIIKVFGQDVYDTFKKNMVEDYVDLHREFETKKRGITNEVSGKQTIKVPAGLFETYVEVRHSHLKEDIAKNDRFKGKLSVAPGKLRLDPGVMEEWFKDSCDNTINHMAKLFKDPVVKGTETILLVGGFSECGILQDAIKSKFSSKRLIIPEEAGLAVLKGAVMFGFYPLTITARRAKCSYGIMVYRDFDPKIHPEDKKVKSGKRFKCKDMFAVHVRKGDELVVDTVQHTQKCNPLERDQCTLTVEIYTSSEEDPTFVDDPSCSKLGELEVEIPVKGNDRSVNVAMKFGGTELIVEGKTVATGEVSKVKFDFLI